MKLLNPEEEWVPSKQVSVVSRAEVEKYLGPTPDHLRSLSGGQSNTNIQVGEEKVLRFYRRDSEAAGKELSLLQKSWKNFVSPQVISSGAGFILMNYVKHSSLEDGAEQGEAVGKALAEIHSFQYPTGGFLKADLSVEEPMEKFVEDMWAYLCSFEEQVKGALDEEFLDEVLGYFDDCMDDLHAAAGKNVLLHGDFKVSNLRWTDQNKPLVLDWEFAYAGSALMDLGQLFRWPSSAEFKEGFVKGYLASGGSLTEGWEGWAQTMDLINLVGLLAASAPGSKRAQDVTARIQKTLQTV